MPGLMIIFVLIALIAAAGALALSEFQDTRITGALGCNSTDESACGYAYNISQQGLVGLDNSTSFLGTQGTIIAVVALIGIVISGFAFKRSL